MKKILVILSLVFLVGCSNGKKDVSKMSESSSQSTEKISTTTKSAVSSTQKSKKTQESTSTSESVDPQRQKEQQKLEAYNELPIPLKVLLATTVVDQRGETPGLQGFGLGYKFDGEFLFVQINSGAGVGHPWFKLRYDAENIYPVEAVVGASATTYENLPVSTAPVSKLTLYDKYINAKESYDSALSHVTESENMSETKFEELKKLVNN